MKATFTHPVRISLLCSLLAIGLPLSGAYAQTKPMERSNSTVRSSPNASVGQTIGTTVVTVTYGRPSVKSREIFGKLVPYGEIWRAGANESTNITFSKDVVIAGKPVAAGTYSLYMIPTAELHWKVILNRKLSWGTAYDPAEDLFRFERRHRKVDFTEQLVFFFENVGETSADLVMRWETTELRFLIQVASAG